MTWYAGLEHLMPPDFWKREGYINGSWFKFRPDVERWEWNCISCGNDSFLSKPYPEEIVCPNCGEYYIHIPMNVMAQLNEWNRARGYSTRGLDVEHYWWGHEKYTRAKLLLGE